MIQTIHLEQRIWDKHPVILQLMIWIKPNSKS